MGLRNRTSKFSGKMTKERWLLLLLIGVLLVILLFPLPGSQKKDKEKENQTAADSQGPGTMPFWTRDAQDSAQTGESFMFGSLGQNRMGGGSSENGEGDPAHPASASPGREGPYETQMENRIKNPLKSVDGVGKMDVVVVLKSSNEKATRVDRSTSSSTTQGKGSGGGTREVADSQSDENTVLFGLGSNGSGNMSTIEKKLSPEISGIIISAEGGGSLTIKAEISEAVEVLFGLPSYKIKVLKRVEQIKERRIWKSRI